MLNRCMRKKNCKLRLTYVILYLIMYVLKLENKKKNTHAKGIYDFSAKRRDKITFLLVVLRKSINHFTSSHFCHYIVAFLGLLVIVI